MGKLKLQIHLNRNIQVDVSYGRVNNQLNTASKERYNLTYNANQFMDGSAYLTNEVRAFAATGNQEHYDNDCQKSS